QGNAVVTTGMETRGLHIANYHRMMLERAKQSIDEIDPALRDISSLTFCVGEYGLQRIKSRIQRFREELVALATLENDGERVIQLNFQLFPLTTGRGED